MSSTLAYLHGGCCSLGVLLRPLLRRFHLVQHVCCIGVPILTGRWMGEEGKDGEGEDLKFVIEVL